MAGNHKEDPLKKRPAYYLKAGSSISVREWKEETAEMVRPRSGLIARPASHPQMVVDLSVDMVEESLYRRTLHDYLCKEEPDAFKKLFLPESPSEFYLQRHLVRDYLLDMHQFHAPHDIATPQFPITKSLKEKPPPAELRTFVEDFLQPKNLTRRRVTGYSPGHIRSLLDLDTFGPNHSQNVEKKRMTGLLPMSPNASRFSPNGGRLSGISEIGSRLGSRRGSLAASASSPTTSFKPTVSFVEDRAMSPSEMMQMTLDDEASEGSAEVHSTAVSTTKSMTFTKSAVEIAELDEDIRKSNPTYKRLQYAKLLKTKAEMKAQHKLEMKKQKKMADKLRAEVTEYKSSLNHFERKIMSSRNGRVS